MFALPWINIIEPRSKEFEIISLQQFQQMLRTSKGAKIITLVTITKPELIKWVQTELSDRINNLFYDTCIKVSKINGIVNFQYENAVNNQLKKEGKETEFIPQPRKWGTRLNDSPFVAHVTKEGKNRLYLEIFIKSSLDHKYYNSETSLPIEEKDIEPWLKKREDARKFQGTDKEIILRDYNVENIICVIINKQGFLIKENIK